MQTLLLLHGAIGASSQLEPIATELSKDYTVYTFDFSGHGGKAFADKPFSIALFAEEVLQFIEEKQLEQVSVFGYSMGGYVAMYLARHYPGKVHKIITLATKFHWDEETAVRESKMLQAEKIEEKIPAFAKTLAERHAPNDWKEVLQRTQEMLRNMGADNPLKLPDYEHISNPCLVLIGDRDKMISLEETVNVYKALPNAQMSMLPLTHHPIEQVNSGALLFLLGQFLG